MIEPTYPLERYLHVRTAYQPSLIVYPDEGHGLVKLTNRLDAYPKMAAFLARHV